MTDTQSGTDGLTDDVEAALRNVRDPDADVNVFEAGIVENIREHAGEVTVVAAIEQFEPGERSGVTNAMLQAVSAVEGVEHAHIEQTGPTPAGEEQTAGLGAVDRIIAVASAKGGVGKSTVAVNLTCALARTETVGLFDADIHGPNVPSLLGASGPVYSDEDGHPLPVQVEPDPEGEPLGVMSVGLMEEGAPLAWRGAMAHDALTELFEDTAWGERNTLVIDLPPGTGDVALTTLQEVPVDGVVFVTTPFHSAVSDTGRSLALFRENDVPVLGVVQNMAGFTCENCGHDHHLFQGDADLSALDAPVLAELPFDPSLQSTPVPGSPNAEFGALADAVSDRYETIWDVAAPDDAVDLRGVPPEERRSAVAAGFERHDRGDAFTVLSDRDPSPVVGYLAELAEMDPEAFDTVEVEQQNPETWFLRTTIPPN